jgi:hypothetical protein
MAFAGPDEKSIVGISPGLSIDEHQGKYGSPVDRFDLLIYTGSSLMGRESRHPVLRYHRYCRRWTGHAELTIA